MAPFLSCSFDAQSVSKHQNDSLGAGLVVKQFRFSRRCTLQVITYRSSG
jgi:hypothetical protein